MTWTWLSSKSRQKTLGFFSFCLVIFLLHVPIFLLGILSRLMAREEARALAQQQQQQVLKL